MSGLRFLLGSGPINTVFIGLFYGFCTLEVSGLGL
jgi:hypothetical protein